MMWSGTLGKMCIWCDSLGSMCLASLSFNTDICPFEDNLMTCSLSSVCMTGVQSACRYLEHLHVGIIWMSLILRYPVSLSLAGCMATDANCAQIFFFFLKFANTTSTKSQFWVFHVTILRLGAMENMISSMMSYICTFQDAYKDAKGSLVGGIPSNAIRAV